MPPACGAILHPRAAGTPSLDAAALMRHDRMVGRQESQCGQQTFEACRRSITATHERALSMTGVSGGAYASSRIV
jgi:hypothetical protein